MKRAESSRRQHPKAYALLVGEHTAGISINCFQGGKQFRLECPVLEFEVVDGAPKKLPANPQKSPAPDAAKDPPIDPTLDRKNARSVVEAYLAAAMIGDGEKVASLAKGSATEFKQIESFLRNLKPKQLTIKSVHAKAYLNRKGKLTNLGTGPFARPAQAVAITEGVTLNEALPDGLREGVFVLQLRLSEESWFITVIDFKSEESADRELKEFHEANPNAVSVPPQATSEAVKSTTGTEETKTVVTPSDEKPVAKPPGANIVKVPDELYVNSGLPLDELAGEGVKWNDVQNGLSLGYRITGDEWGILSKGAKVELWVRNPGDKDVRFQCLSRPDIGLLTKMMDTKGKEHESNIARSTSLALSDHRLLSPGHAFKVKEFTVSLLRPENDASGVDGHYFAIAPGAYKFHCELELPGFSATGKGGKQLTPAAGEWTGKLTTRELAIMVVAPDSPTRRD